MDELYWQPGWRETTNEKFQAKIREKLAQSDGGWIVDGDYEGKMDNIVAPETTDIICESLSNTCPSAFLLLVYQGLDPPLVLYFPRIFYRTMLRLLGLRKPCSPGCPERLSETLSKRGILWWCLSNHWRNQRKGRARMAEIGVGSGTNLGGRKMRRLGGWGGEVKRWLKEVETMCYMRGRVSSYKLEPTKKIEASSNTSI